MGKRSRRRRIMFWSLIAVGILVVLVGVFTLVANHLIINSADDYVIASPEDAPHAQCAVVLGARVFANGTLYAMTADRLEVAIQLYDLGKVDRLLISGDHGTTTYDEVNAMLEYAVERGVPEEDVFTDHAGFDTYDTMYRARHVFMVESAIVVTQSYHLSRAVYTARALGLEAVGVGADLRPYLHPLRNQAREILARVKAVIQLNVTHPGPRFLGPQIPITGDGRATRG
jgi:SanA protein